MEPLFVKSLSSLLLSTQPLSLGVGLSPSPESLPPSEQTRSVSSKAAFRKWKQEAVYAHAIASLTSSSIGLLEPHYVGELQEKWQFPSDHLPVGARVDDVNIASWNVLNKEYMSWVYMNTQGLSHSSLTQENYVIDSSGLTLREAHVIEALLESIHHPSCPKHVLALQECGEDFITALEKELPPYMKIVLSAERPVKDQNILIYDSRVFNLVETESKIVTDAYPSSPGRSLMDIILEKKDSSQHYRIVNVHVPGDPNLPGRNELAEYMFRTKKDSEVSIVLGDMNFDVSEMREAFDLASKKQDLEESPFSLLATYYTNIGLQKEAKCIDHILVDFGNRKGIAEALSAEEVMPSMLDTLSLLN